MPERIIPNQVLGFTFVPKEAITGAAAIPCGPAGKLFTEVEGGTYAKKWAPNSGPVSSMHHAHTCHDGFGSPDEDYCCDEQSVQRFPLVPEGHCQWQKLRSRLGLGVHTEMGRRLVAAKS